MVECHSEVVPEKSGDMAGEGIHGRLILAEGGWRALAGFVAEIPTEDSENGEAHFVLKRFGFSDGEGKDFRRARFLGGS